ncbi:MAG: 50S ribosomal protein L22 [Candidatus Saccharimonadales bacterium]
MKAIANGLRVPPRKMNMVAALVRKRDVTDALVILDHTPRRAAQALREVIKSAAANAEHNDKVDPSKLEIAAINVGTGGMIKRMRPNARLSVRPYRHRLSNVTVSLQTKGDK